MKPPEDVLDRLMSKLWDGLVEPGMNHSEEEHEHMKSCLAEAYEAGAAAGKASAQREALWDLGPLIGGMGTRD